MSKKSFTRLKLKNSNLLTTGFGRLTPFYLACNIPKDRLTKSDGFNVQFMPMLAPAFQDCRMYVHYYWVPERILHINEEYNAFVSRENRTLATLSAVPTYKSYTTLGDICTALNTTYRNNQSGSVVPWDYSKGFILNQLPDYMRVQLGEGSDYSKNSDKILIEPFVAYFKIFLDHYCSTQYNTFMIESTNTDGSYNYHSIPYDDLVWFFSYLQKIGFNTYVSMATGVTLPKSGIQTKVLLLLMQVLHVQYGRKGDMFMELYPSTDEVASTQPTGSTIEALRLNNLVTKYKERIARVGHGVREFYEEFFGFKSKSVIDGMSKFLGGGRCNINIDDVLQSSETTETSALGELGGNGWKKSAFGHGRRFFDDYGYAFGLVYFIPKQSYYQGIDDLYGRIYPDDMYLEAFDSVGDEGVKLRELYTSTNDITNDTILGYQPRYRRYDRAKDEIHGDFCQSLLYWHQSRLLPNTVTAQNIRQVFAAPQGLNRIFNYNGIVSEAGEQPIMLYVRNVAKWKRNKRYSPRPHL